MLVGQRQGLGRGATEPGDVGDDQLVARADVVEQRVELFGRQIRIWLMPETSAAG
jgi:hypothetical protein